MPRVERAADNTTEVPIPTRDAPYTPSLCDDVGRAMGLRDFTAKVAAKLAPPSTEDVQRARAVRARAARGIGLSAKDRQKCLVSAAKANLRSALSE